MEKVVTVKTNGNCGRSGGSIEVTLNGKVYHLGIRRNDCISGKYRIGDEVKVLYGASYDYIILPETKTELGFYMSLLFFILPMYCLVKTIRH
jgi:hypothetical protein